MGIKENLAELERRDRDALLGCYDFPAEHWDHGRTTKPLARVFAAVWHRMVRTKGARS